MGNKLGKIAVLALSVALLQGTFRASNAQENYVFDINPNYSSLQGSVVFVPQGATTRAILSQNLSSKTAVEGTSIFAMLNNDFTYNGSLIAPYGSTLNGTIVKAKRAGFGDRNGQIQVRFTGIRTPNGYTIPISATIATSDGSGILKGGTALDSAKDYAKNVALGAAGGALSGTIMAPLSGGKVGRGAALGTAVGGGIGLLNAARQKGEDVEIPANAVLDIYFDQPITISAPSGY